MTKIAIIGKPNVGKSTIFNRLIKRNLAITSDIPGTTRDRNIQKISFEGYDLTLIDTSGLESETTQDMETDMKEQANTAITEADITLFVLDITEDPDINDLTVAQTLRKSKKPVILIANKFDNEALEQNIYSFYELGFGEPIPVSAIHKTGIEKLKEALLKNLKKIKAKKKKITAKKQTGIINICILGKPNAGKSSLLNALCGSKRAIVSEIPGTTRDTVDTEIEYKKEKFKIIDTAGLRKRGKIERGIEKYSSLRTTEMVENSDIIVLLIDGFAGISSQDQHITEYAFKYKKGLIITINKIDLMDEDLKNRMIRRLKIKFPFLPWAPVIFISAKDKKNTEKVLEIASDIHKERNKRIKTAELNAFLQRLTNLHLPASTKVTKPKFMYATQADTSPPKFVLHFKHPENLHFSYPRYLENSIRKEYGFNGTAIDLVFKGYITKEEK
ncbi:MAG: ribosome biogenesis GTPase Der [Candidatus Gracilibacteria bacterium]|jgi:GTP-binding protein|nr:ribosome biogenesis GTPase Der [Candidatus Gracilibacteria bacterium]